MNYYSFSQLAQAELPQDIVLTIGNFDGVHLGHKHILEKLRTPSCETLLITFNPYPFEVFKTEVARIYSPQQKSQTLHNLVDHVLYLDFNEIRELAPQDFIYKITQAIKVKKIFIGDDFRFGKNREGDFSTLVKAGKERGFIVESLPTVKITPAQEALIREDLKGIHSSFNEELEKINELLASGRYSSTLVRLLYKVGCFKAAKTLLAGEHPYIVGQVIEGRKLARTLKVPTANLQLPSFTLLRGVYFCEVKILSDNNTNSSDSNITKDGEKLYFGVCNIGYKPTVSEDNNAWFCEVHILDFDADLYGKEISVQPLYFRRPEKRFSSLEELKENIYADVKASRDFFGK